MTDAELCAMYDKANGTEPGRRSALTTARILKAMRAARASGECRPYDIGLGFIAGAFVVGVVWMGIDQFTAALAGLL